MRLLFLGPPGVGKGTQAARVAEASGIAHISTGDMFRHHISEGTPLGKQVRRILDRGDLVPDAVTVEMLTDRLVRADAADGYILDGFPRTLPQARALDEAIGEDTLDGVVVLTAPADVLVERMLARGRADDTETSVRNRLVVYERETAPLIGFYEERGIALPVRGTGAIEDITDRILEVLSGPSRA